MPETSYWYVATAPLSIPYRTEVTFYETELGDERVIAPMLFTTREAAETELGGYADAEPEAYLRAVNEYGVENMDEALDNTPELRVFEIDSWLLGEHLKDSDLMYVMVDGQVRLAWELAEELRG